MSVDFVSPSYRAAASDLAVSISPLGLIELSDEEFEVHGPRINRYAQNWAFYLGHHWSYRREVGEPQLTFNYVRAFSDYITNFVFGKGVEFRSPHQTEGIVPYALKRVWDTDNNKHQILWEMGQSGSVTGDSFVKVAYEPEWEDPAGNVYPGRVRVLPLPSAYCFPEWHPHDKERLLRFKLKYRFWSTTQEGTRQVFTYTEILTDSVIQEYVNDQLIDERPNPLGVVPVVHVRNYPISGSPWGLADVQDLVSLNREFNEKCTEISDIINYHSAPITIITGAKASNLEKGPKKIWGGLPADASVFSLQNGVELSGPMAFLEQLKRSMHEITGVPEQALGQMQPISNTSGVALAIQYQPLMNRYNLKKIQYARGIERINELILRTLALYEPESMAYNYWESAPLKPGQAQFLDPADPLTYVTDTFWPPPLPVDQLITLNEVNTKMQMGLESQRGALRQLGEEFPDVKIEEIFEEQMEDARRQAALDMVHAQYAAAVQMATGLLPTQEGGVEQPRSPGGGEGGGGAVGGPPQPAMTPEGLAQVQQRYTEIVTEAFGPKSATRLNPEKPEE
jgi:hypothetical protein